MYLFRPKNQNTKEDARFANFKVNRISSVPFTISVRPRLLLLRLQLLAGPREDGDGL